MKNKDHNIEFMSDKEEEMRRALNGSGDRRNVYLSIPEKHEYIRYQF